MAARRKRSGGCLLKGQHTKNMLLLESRRGMLGLSKVRSRYKFGVGCLLAGLVMGPMGGHGSDEIRTYTIPKEPAVAGQATQPAPGDSTMPAADIPVSSAPVHWIAPAGWKDLGPADLRLGNFAVPGPDGSKADVGIFSFPGSVGTELGNVNRWRGELKLPSIEQNEIRSEPITIDSMPGRLYDMTGAADRTVVASLPRNEATWFFKMRGPKEIVGGTKPVFLDFLKSVHFSAPPTEATAATPPDNSQSGPQWSVPANWKEKTPGPMVFKSFTAVEENGKTAAVNISFFQGDVGGKLANVNRWRGQVGLPEVEASGLTKVTRPLETAGGAGTLVDFTGTDVKTGESARLVAVTVPHGADTWFYKLLGDGPVVEKEKDNFVKFVQTVHYP